MKTTLTELTLAGVLLLAVTPAQADWPNTNATKWVQYPDPFNGLDVSFSQPLILADDFQCTNTGPITDIHIWASWLGNNPDPNTVITLGIWTDVPAVPPNNPYSHPGSLLWSQTFGPGQYAVRPWMTAQEPFWNPDTGILGYDSMIFQYNFYPANPFVQQGSTAAPQTYWLSVTAGQNTAPFGWKTSTNQWGDVAVYGHVLGGTVQGDWQRMLDPRTQQVPLSLSFALTTTNAANPPPTSLPIYHVLQSGATATQAVSLANSLGIPSGSLVMSNGEASFIDPTNFMPVPTSPVTDPVVISNLLAGTENPYPNIPIRFEQIDFGALSNLTVLNSNTALASASNALANAGLTPQWGAPVIGHTTLKAWYSNDNNSVISNSQSLDTHVLYQFSTPGGYPIVGPGAQVQVAYGSNGAATRLLYATRQLSLQITSTVPVISPTVAGNRAARLFSGLNAQITPQLVYYAPPLSLGTVASIIPWYQCGGTAPLTNPGSGQVFTLNLMPVLIPATDDPNFVPAANLLASVVGGTQVVASVTVGGGAPPYAYLWAGSSPAVSGNTGANIAYTPVVRITPPLLGITRVAPGSVVVWWPYPADGFSLEANTDLVPTGWTPVTNPVQTNNGLKSVTVNLSPSRATFFRLRLTSQTLPETETVMVTVTDANGVSAQASQTLQVQAMPVSKAAGGGNSQPSPRVVGLVDWGTESPFDPGLGVDDRVSWTSGMTAFGGGVQRFCWTGGLSWREDFIDALTGVNNYEVDNADITLYIGHGNPTVITFTGGPGPSPTNLFFNEATHSWGNLDQEWMCFLSCDVLEYTNAYGNAWQRWGPDFDGLHILMGFESPAWPGTGFPATFAYDLLGFVFQPPLPVVSAWFSAALGRGTGSPAALGPIGPGGTWDFRDYYWGRGAVGPTIRSSQIHGWWYLSQP